MEMRDTKKEARRIAFFLPNIFTGLNMACGFASVIFTTKGDFFLATLLVLLGGIFDLVDGRIARLTGTQSNFGEQFDSMSDLITFGLAPSFLMYHFFLHGLGRPGLVVSFLFLLCGALRLARFNANIEKVSSSFFQGLPIPGGAFALAGFVFLAIEYPVFKKWDVVALFYMLFYSILMISNVPFNSFKNSQWVKNHRRATLLIIFLILSSFFMYEEVMIFAFITIYTVGSLVYFFLHKGEFKNVFEWKGDSDPT